MASLNRVMLVGRVLDDPEARTTFSGTPVLRFKLKVDRPAEFSTRESSDILEIVAWDRWVEQSKSFLFRDALILVEGRLQIRSFDGTDGRKRYVTEVVARMIRALGGGGKPQPVAVGGATEEVDFTDFEADESLAKALPF